VAVIPFRGSGELSDDVGVIVQTTRNCAFLVFLLTSILGGNAAREKFIEKHKHTVYETKFQAFVSISSFFCNPQILTSEIIIYSLWDMLH